MHLHDLVAARVDHLDRGAAVLALVMQGQMHRADVLFAGNDLLLGLLFVIAYFITPVSVVVAR